MRALALTGVFRPLTWLLALIAIALPACGPRGATPAFAEVDPPRLNAAGDSAYLTARFTAGPITDGQGPPSGFRLQAVRLAPTPSLTVLLDLPANATSGTIAVPVALAPGGTASGTICVMALRNGASSSCAPNPALTWSKTWPVLPPSPPANVTLDPVTISMTPASDTVGILFALSRTDFLKALQAPGCAGGNQALCAVSLAAAFPGGSRGVLQAGCGWMITGTPRAYMAFQEPPTDRAATRWMDCQGLGQQIGFAGSVDTAIAQVAFAFVRASP